MVNATLWGWILLLLRPSGSIQPSSDTGFSINYSVLVACGLVEVAIFLYGMRQRRLFQEKPFLNEKDLSGLQQFFGK